MDKLIDNDGLNCQKKRDEQLHHRPQIGWETEQSRWSEIYFWTNDHLLLSYYQVGVLKKWHDIVRNLYTLYIVY